METSVPTEEKMISRDKKMFLVRPHVIEQFKELGVGMSLKVLKKLNYKVARIIIESARRCKENDRKTVLERDV